MHINMEIVKWILENLGMLSTDFKKYGKVYLNTTENISGIMSKIDLKDKNVLAVAGSGDQAINAYLNGAKKVTLFDINPLTYPQVELKLTAAKKLNHDELCEFFIPKFGNLLNYKTFFKLSNYLKEDVATYYDYLYSKFTPKEIFAKTFYQQNPDPIKLEAMNDYMKKDNFLMLPKILEDKEITYIESSLIDLPTKLEENYDTILLSNLSDSLEDLWNINTLKCYKRFIHILSNSLNNEGIIQCGYIYSSYKTQLRNPIFANTTKRQQVFTRDEFSEWNVETYVPESEIDDIVVIYKKKRRKVA